MKKLLIITIAILNGFLFLDSQATAFPVSVSDRVIMMATNGTSYSLPYSMTIAGTDTTFITFCLEAYETFDSGATYNVKSIEDYAESGGIDRDGDNDGYLFRDYLDRETRQLYAAYASGSYGSIGNAEKLVQYAIWYIEDEKSGETYKNAYTRLLNAFDFTSFDIEGWEIKAVNLVDDWGHWKQSQLVGTAPVPEPATMFLLGIGLIGVAAATRKKYPR